MVHQFCKFCVADACLFLQFHFEATKKHKKNPCSLLKKTLILYYLVLCSHELESIKFLVLEQQ